ncbi:MAG: hypothetical protein CFE21_12205 [Bacteroidetes bacterium B1(2017)]|nr:MAG: hypothetical protein CFE21_12205 [Bacteroidetes bacterium B1(2017)]
MEFNLISYCLYLPATFYITIVIGKDLNQQGAHFLLQTFAGDTELVQTLNKFLLIGYYLINLGYAAVSVNFFSQIDTWLMLVEELTLRLGMLLMGLGFIHYFNLFALTTFTKQIQHLFSNQTTS